MNNKRCSLNCEYFDAEDNGAYRCKKYFVRTALGRECRDSDPCFQPLYEMENWSLEECEQAKENLKKSIDRAVEIGNTKHHVKGETDYHAKQDYGKAKLSLVPRRIIWDVATIREYGNNKYPDGGPDNWRGVEPERYRDAAYRHFLRYLDDPKSVDSESGLPHLWHLACNIAFLCEMEDRYLSKNTEVVDKLKKAFRGYQPPSNEGEECKDE